MIKGQSMQYYGAAAKKGAAAKNGEKIAMLPLSNVAERGIDSRGHALVMGPSHSDYWL